MFQSDRINAYPAAESEGFDFIGIEREASNRAVSRMNRDRNLIATIKTKRNYQLAISKERKTKIKQAITKWLKAGGAGAKVEDLRNRFKDISDARI